MNNPSDDYQVFNPEGELVLGASVSCRYPKPIEQSILDAGYTIRLRGRKIIATKQPQKGEDQ